MNLTWLGKLLPYWLIERIVKNYSKDKATLNIGRREFNVKLLFMGNKESGFWYSSTQELRKRKRQYESSIEEVKEKIAKLDTILEKEK